MKKILLSISLIVFLFGCGDDTQPAEENTVNEMEEETALLFSNMDLQVEANTFTLTGEVKSKAPEFYYKLDIGEEELMGEEVYELQEAPDSWQDFEITGEVPAAELDEESTPILTLYAKSADGDMLHKNFIPIDIGE